ncbi:MAG: PQQ-binding-like beta-propeller repeat protein [Planctomycetes bacterium]|nr:PQQ-binding-like beta-propeller repeat protein [Planctomycetota bacterium]
MRNSASALGSLSLLAIFAVALAAQEPAPLPAWSRFRGPNGAGSASPARLPVHLGDPELKLWRTELPAGHSSPVLSGEHVFLTAEENETLFLYALARTDGRVAWRREVARERRDVVDQRNHPASPTPAVDAQRIVVFFPDVGLLAFDHAGKELWKKPLGPFRNVYGMGASPILAGELALLACDQNQGSYLLAVDARSGETRWKAERPWARSGHCTPILWRTPQGEEQVLLPGSFELDAYALASGERRWWVQGLSFEMKSVPVMLGDTLYINGYGSPENDPGRVVERPELNALDTNGDGVLARDEVKDPLLGEWHAFVDLDGSKTLDAAEWDYLGAALRSRNGLLAIACGGSGDRTKEAVKWTYHRSVPQLPSMLIGRSGLFVLHDQGGLVTVLDPFTGEMKQRARLDHAIDSYYASPVACDGLVVFASTSGLVSICRDALPLETRAVHDFEEPIYATPAIEGGVLYLRTEKALYAFRHREPAAVKSYQGRVVAQTMHWQGAGWLMRETREKEEAPEQLLGQLGLREGMTVADLGCGNGFHALRIARRIGAGGRVLAVDLQPEMLRLLEALAAKEQLENIRTIECESFDPHLPPRSCDLILMVDVYHELSHPEPVLRRVREALKPGGRLALVEFRTEDKDVPIKPEHKMSKAQCLLELEANGFRLASSYDELPWQHLLFFEPTR